MYWFRCHLPFVPLDTWCQCNQCTFAPYLHQVVVSNLLKMLVKLGIFSSSRGENKKYLKPPAIIWFFLVVLVIPLFRHILDKDPYGPKHISHHQEVTDVEGLFYWEISKRIFYTKISNFNVMCSVGRDLLMIYKCLTHVFSLSSTYNLTSLRTLPPLHYMSVSENGGTPKSSILIGFSIINHPFWGTPIFGNTHIHQSVT